MGIVDSEAAGEPIADDKLRADAKADTDAIGSTVPIASSAQGPGGRYGPLFVELIQKSRWTRSEADCIARSLGLMLDAGVEAINDWAFDALDAPLIEIDGDALVIERSLFDDA